MEKNAKQNPSLIVILTGCALVLIFLFFGLKISRGSGLLPLPGEEEMRSGLPVRLAIPRIGVDVAMEFVGLTPEGAMAVPKDPANAAWFDQGPAPRRRG